MSDGLLEMIYAEWFPEYSRNPNIFFSCRNWAGAHLQHDLAASLGLAVPLHMQLRETLRQKEILKNLSHRLTFKDVRD